MASGAKKYAYYSKDTLYTASMTNKKMTKAGNNTVHIPENMPHNLRSRTNEHGVHASSVCG